jgi:hypothetical protein
VTNAIVGIDLAERKQMVVVTDHDSKVLARRTFRCKAWDLGAALDWAAGRGARGGYAGGTVACEPTGHRWRVLGQLATERGMSFVCVQPAGSRGLPPPSAVTKPSPIHSQARNRRSAAEKTAAPVSASAVGM